MSKKSIEELARERAEESAKREAWAAHFMAYLPFVLIACIMATTGVPTVLYMILVLTGLVVAVAIYLSMKQYAYKKYYEKYLEEFAILRESGDDE